MASCNLGTSHLKLTKLEFGRVNVNALHQRCGSRTSMGRKQLQFAGLAISHDKKKAYTVCRGSPSETESSNRVECPEDSKSSGLVSQLIPNSSEVESLVTQVCDATSIAEFELKLGGFRLYVMRELKEKSTPLPPPPSSPAPAYVSTASSDAVSISVKKASDSNGSASTSLAITKREPSAVGIQSLLDGAADEGLMILQSPRVGFFRRSRTIKGKRAPPACKEKQIVKEGQVVCYIEQLGGELPIESDVGGEVIKILREDGEPVGYGDALIAVLPSFPGIKKLQ